MLKKISLITIILFFCTFLWGCTDDVFNNDNRDNEREGLRICVPHIDFTRADISEPTAAEKKLQSLVFFAYKIKDSQVEKLKTYILVKDSKPNDKVSYGSYDQYEIDDLETGDYQFYLVANNPDFMGKETSEIEASYGDIDKLKSQIMTFHNPGSNGISYFDYDGVKSSAESLPMSCDHFSMKDKEGKTFTGNYSFDGSASIYADLTFCLSKVTVVVENPTGEYVKLSKAQLVNYASGFPVFTTDDLFIGENKNEIEKTFSDNDHPSDMIYTFYVPETKYSGQPVLNVMIDGVKDPVEINLGEKNAKGENDLLRGVHYAYTLNTKGKIELNVYEWTLEALIAEITGPFELVLLDKPYIDVLASGDKKEIRFTTDAEADRISGVSPKITIDGKEYDFYNIKIEDNYKAVVNINPRVPLATLQSIASNEEKMAQYNYFYIKANNLLKRVEIGQFQAAPVFEVTPEEITINVNEYFASNANIGELRINYNTNLSGVKCNFEDVRWEDEDGNLTTYNTNIKSSSDGSEIFVFKKDNNDTNGEDVISLGGLTAGEDFWTSKKKLVLTYTVEGAPDDWTEDMKKRTVTINVKPYNSRYIIHFKVDNGTTWANPHIYVYQCLEVPYGLPNAGKTIGYDWSNNTDAALEYCFTSDIAFKGFEGYGGSFDINKVKNATYDSSKGFVMIADLAVYGNVGDSDDKKYKFMRFNQDHWKKISDKGQKNCDDDFCKGYESANTGSYLWPGVIMYYEESGDAKGWWTYELSGVATPGKALIMFANWHTGAGGRFPGDNLVGVPLFDYEDKEGWFLLKNSNESDYVNNRFYDENPLLPQPETAIPTGYQRIYFYKSGLGDKNIYYHVWESSNQNNRELGKMTRMKSDGWYYCTIPTNKGFNRFLAKPNENDWNGQYTGDLEFSSDSQKVYFDENGSTSRKP